jgi:hypothetical protein
MDDIQIEVAVIQPFRGKKCFFVNVFDYIDTYFMEVKK